MKYNIDNCIVQNYYGGIQIRKIKQTDNNFTNLNFVSKLLDNYILSSLSYGIINIQDLTNNNKINLLIIPNTILNCIWYNI
jgi:hypothetical protein